jgi:hypothetical protein
MGRVSAQHTLGQLEDLGCPFPIKLVCPPEEAHKHWGRPVLPCGEVGIAATRQWIMENAPEPFVVMMDDDLTFYERRADERDKFTKLTKQGAAAMFRALEDALGLFAHVSIAMREGGNRNTDLLLIAVRSARVIGYRKDIFLQEGVDFRNSTVMDDFEATLHLLTRGWPSGVLNDWVQNQVGSGTKGGASLYRTLEVHAAAAHKLAQRYPRFVRTVVKKTKTAWGGQERVDVLVQWKKALEAGKGQYGIRTT